MGLQTPLAESLIPGNMDNTLSYGVLSYIKKLRNQAKVEYDRLCNEVMSRVSANKGMTNVNNNGVLEGLRVTPRDNFKKDLVTFEILIILFYFFSFDLSPVDTNQSLTFNSCQTHWT